MMRTHVVYAGIEYVIAHRSIDEVKGDLRQLREAGSGWLAANYGEGRLQKTELLIEPGIPVALFEVDE